MITRRQSLFALGGLAVATFAGCSKLSFLPQPRKKKVAGYAAVENGMNEAQVVKLMGTPTRRSGIGLEGSNQRAVNLTYVASNSLITITIAGGEVISKQKF